MAGLVPAISMRNTGRFPYRDRREHKGVYAIAGDDTQATDREDDMRAADWPTLILMAVSLSGGGACAQAFTPDPVDEAAAKREGAVTWYTSTPVRAAQYIATEFERQTGI